VGYEGYIGLNWRPLKLDGINIRAFLCGVPTYASAELHEFLCLD